MKDFLRFSSMVIPDASTVFPAGYQQRLQRLLEAEWQVGESYARFAERLGLGSGKTVKAWLGQDFRAEPDPQKLRKLGRSLGWQYWELIRYLDTGESPSVVPVASGEVYPLEEVRVEQAEESLVESSRLIPPSRFSRGDLMAATRQMQELAANLGRFLAELPWEEDEQRAGSPELGVNPRPELEQEGNENEKAVIPAMARIQPLSSVEEETMPVSGVMTLPRMIAVCLEKAALSPGQLRDRIEDYQRYSSLRSPLTQVEFEAMCEGRLIPQSEAQLEELADIVDRDRQYFTGNDWLKAWIASIYHGNPSSAPPS